MNAMAHLFLDRDGTLIREENYLRDASRVALEDGVLEGLKLFASSGYRLVVVSNQSGIGRGLITASDVAAVNTRIDELLIRNHITISSWHYCPHRPDEGCTCRKPGSGLLKAAAALHPIDWQNSLIVGDKPSDVQAGISVGIGAALITSGYGSSHIEWALAQNVKVVNSIVELFEYASLIRINKSL